MEAFAASRHLGNFISACSCLGRRADDGPRRIFPGAERGPRLRGRGKLDWLAPTIISIIATWLVARLYYGRSNRALQSYREEVGEQIKQLGETLVAELPARLEDAVRPYLLAGKESAAAAAIRRRLADHVQRATQAIIGAGGIPSGEKFGTPGIVQQAPRATQVNPLHAHTQGQHFGESATAEPEFGQKKPEEPGPYGSST